MLWEEGLSWLSNLAEWPIQHVLEPAQESKSDAKEEI